MFGRSRLTHFTNFNLRKLTGQQSIGAMIMNNRLRWLGHVVRMDERMPKRIMFGKLQTVRPQAVMSVPPDRYGWVVWLSWSRVGMVEMAGSIW